MTALAAGPSSKITMLIRAGRSTGSFKVQSVTFDHANVGRRRLRGPQPTDPSEITVMLSATPAVQTALKPDAKLVKVDLVLYVTDPYGHQHLLSKIEIGNPTVASYTLSADKKDRNC